MTDGIAISKLTLDGIDFLVYDFAGQAEYVHTHSLFFEGEKSLFLVVYRRDSDKAAQRDFDSFLDMINNCAPNTDIILATTFVDDDDTSKGRLTEDEIHEIKMRNPQSRITYVIPLDSKTGTGIEDLKDQLVTSATAIPNIEREIPNSFDFLQDQLDLFADQNIFSISSEEFHSLAVEKVGMSEDIALLAVQLFCEWGSLHRLSNDDLVLKPQQLADVLACVFTKDAEKLSHIGDLLEGLLMHDSKTLGTIWGTYDYDSRLWNPDDDNNKGKDPPFLELLHLSGLAYPLFDENGKAIAASLVSALLPEYPFGFNPTRIVNDDSLVEFFLTNKISIDIHSTLVLKFVSRLPLTFFSQLQVRLRFLQTLNGSWRNGCFLQMSTNSSTSNKIIEDSFAIILCDNETRDIKIITAGSSTRIRSVVLEEVLKLKEEKYKASLYWESLSCNGVTWDAEKINYFIETNGYLTAPQVPKESIERPISTIAVSPNVKSPQLDDKDIFLNYKELSLLDKLVDRYKVIDDDNEEEINVLQISIQRQIIKCASELADIMVNN